VSPRAGTPSAVPAGAPAGPDAALGRAVLARFFRALGDPTRLDLVAFLLEVGEATGRECVARAGLSQGRVSAHLACLVSCGLVEVRREGRFSHYRVADDRVASLVALAQEVAAGHAESIAECLVVGPALPGRGRHAAS
jgi:DNA-binding transcriptional ArsR family regulator